MWADTGLTSQRACLFARVSDLLSLTMHLVFCFLLLIGTDRQWACIGGIDTTTARGNQVTGSYVVRDAGGLAAVSDGLDADGFSDAREVN